jgi:DNA (cytosine-5)-methyltransferase 1
VLAPLGIGRGNAPRSVEQPVPTVLASPGGGHLVEPIIVDYYGQGTSHPVSVPLSTCRTKQSHGLVEPVAGRQLDILFRMLQPHELARAMSFPEGYVFKGNRTEVVRQIGNAVAVGVAQALCGAALEPAA